MITEAFGELAAATLLSRGMPDLPVAVLPHQTEVLSMEDLRPHVEHAIYTEIIPLIESSKAIE